MPLFEPDVGELMTTPSPDESFRQNLSDHLAGFTAAPILFVGSGLSAATWACPTGLRCSNSSPR